MRTLFIDLDGAFEHQPHAVARAARDGGLVNARDLGPSMRLWARPIVLEFVKARLRRRAPIAGPELVFAGSGDFHHITPLLLERALEAAGAEKVTVVHFDNHPDWVEFSDGLHCGSWVGAVARHPNVARLITIGVCSRDIDNPAAKGADLDLVREGRVEIYPYRGPAALTPFRLCGRDWPTISELGPLAFGELLAGRVETEAVYVTIDKDVLRPQDAVTNWDQGQMSLAELKRLLSGVVSRRRLIGADVVGDWSAPVYGGGWFPAAMKLGEAVLDKPWARPDQGAAGRLNQAVNLELMDLISEITS